MSAAHELPFGQGRRYLRGRALAGLILGDWQANGILKTRLGFHAQAFSLSDAPAFTLANARSASLTVGDCSFGELTGSQSVSRQPQFGLKFLGQRRAKTKRDAPLFGAALGKAQENTKG